MMGHYKACNVETILMDKIKIALEKSQWDLVKELLTTTQGEGILDHEDQLRLEAITSDMVDQMAAPALCT